MEKSPTIAELAKALNKFQGAMGTVVFDSNNPFYKSKYASLATIVASARPILNECGLAISQLVTGEGGVCTILMHESGEYLSSTLTLKSVKDDPQGHGAAITYARRYAYSSILGIVADQDDDGNECSYVKHDSKAIPTQEKPLSNESKPVEHSKAKVEPKNIKIEHLDTDDDKLTNEQGTALLMYLAKNAYTRQDLHEFIFFEFQISKLSEICNKHVPRIKEYFSSKKESK